MKTRILLSAMALGLAVAASAQDAPAKQAITMVPFKTTADSYQAGTTRIEAKRLVQELGDEFNRYFTQSRHYVVLSRQDETALQDESALLAGGNFRSEELEKFGQRVGADVLLTGEIKEFFIAAPRGIATSGGSVVDRAVCSLSYRMIGIATGEILDSDNITVDLTRNEIRQAGGDSLALAQTLLAGAMLEMAKVIDPPKIVKHMKNGDFVINRGGSSVVVGSFLDAYGLEDEIIDPDTGEALGSSEELVGIVQVTRVDKKLSYARLYSGEIDDDTIESGVVVRPHRTTPEEAAAAAKAAEEARAKASQGVRLPFD